MTRYSITLSYITHRLLQTQNGELPLPNAEWIYDGLCEEQWRTPCILTLHVPGARAYVCRL